MNSEVQIQKQKPKKKTIFDDRLYLTNNYVIDGNSNKENISNLRGVPLSSQESCLVEELLYSLVGNLTSHIQPTWSSSGGIEFQLDPSIDNSLKSLISRILPLCANYSKVVGWCEGDEVEGRTNQALVSSIEMLLQDYRSLVCQLEGELRKGNLSLQTLWFRLQNSIHSMDMLAGLVDTISSRKAKGGTTLSILHDKYTHSCGNLKAEKILHFLVELTSKPFFETLSAWLYRGVILDPSKDFFVEDNQVLCKESLPLEYNDDFWEKRYGLRIDKIPTFLQKYSERILRTGKYLNVIQQCEKQVHWPPLENLEYLSNPEDYEPLIEKAHIFASATLLELLVKDRDLIGHLTSMKKYFLMEQGDFIVQFLDLCEKELSQPVDQVEPARLESLLEMALRTSSANYDQNKDNLCVALLPYDLIFQMGKILSIYTSEEQVVDWPVSLVLNHKALVRYQMLFRHLFYCKHIERLISAVWITNKATKFLPGDAFKVYHPSFGLRQKMLVLIQNLSYYMMVEVVEPAWHSLVVSLAACTTVDDVLQKHNDFLDNCLHDCLLSSPQLLGTVKKLLGICAEFSEYMQNLRLSSTDQFNEDISRFELEFNSVLFSLLDKISQLGRDNYNEKVLNILNRIDFNGFYTTAMDQFRASTPAPDVVP
ncbi:gamma-tubulin complex component 2 [Eurytemora carolleeae]|uniref:gamma-tubulin complex component 2 n=1 Tax=Eurytemora carolleeae TaxID=1294199 RepID=UPI000C785107|nr:gamma-tubulin complex component 2 [Eurytemora carolleeae]|eukprot:XP_023342310.1 gamma-tubulin complex component 2-like [Eurytemora affinis]